MVVAALNKLIVNQLMHLHKAQCHPKSLLQMKLFCKMQIDQDSTHLVRVVSNLVPAGGRLLAVALLVKRWILLEQEQARMGPVQHLMLMVQRGKQTVTRDPVLELSVLIALSRNDAAPSMNVPLLRYCYMLDVLNIILYTVAIFICAVVLSFSFKLFNA
jgi:hypothetical protein